MEMTVFGDAADHPLNIRPIRTEVLEGGVRKEDISYVGLPGTEVSATLLRPAPANGAPAGLLMLHWGFGDRSSFLSEGLAYARAGALVLTVDAPGAGDRGKSLPRLDLPDVARGFLIQVVTELRRGVDVLHACGADPDRTGYIGHSLGAAAGVPFVGAEPRLSAAVLMTPLGELSRGGWTLKPDARYAETMAPLDGIRTIGRAAAALYFQFADRDPWVSRDSAERLCAAAPNAKCQWYPADHRLSAPALADRANWLRQRLGLQPSTDRWLDGVGLPKRDLTRHAVGSRLYRVVKIVTGVR